MPREDKILVRKISSLECFMFILGSDRSHLDERIFFLIFDYERELQGFIS